VNPLQRQPLRAVAQGVGVMALIALLGVAVNGVVPTVSGVIVAIVIGMAVRNTVGLGYALRGVVAVASKRGLQAGIILLGAGLSVADVVHTGAHTFLAILLLVVTTLAIVGLLAHRLGIPRNLAVLLAAGTAICGATAILALAPLVRARASEVSFSIATITVFGTCAIAVFPLIGHALAMPENVFGIWSGMAIHETAQVIAAAFQFGDHAVETATIVKLTRTTLLVPLALALAAHATRVERAGSRRDPAATTRRSVWHVFPWFVVGFVVAALVNSLGWVPDTASGSLPSVSKALITFAMAGVGLNTDLREMRSIGTAPLLVGLIGACSMAILSLALLPWRT